MNEYYLNSFLRLGYSLDYKNEAYKLDLSSINKNKYLHYETNDLIKVGAELFLQAIGNNLKHHQNTLYLLVEGWIAEPY